MNEAPQTTIMLFSCSCWIGKLFMCFNLRVTSVHRSQRGGEKRCGCLLQLDDILYSKCWSNVTMQSKHLFSFIILIILTSQYSGCSGWEHTTLMHEHVHLEKRNKLSPAYLEKYAKHSWQFGTEESENQESVVVVGGERLWFWSLDMCQQACKCGPWQTHTGPTTHIRRFVTHPWGRSVQRARSPVSHSFTYIKMSLRYGAFPEDLLLSVTACVDFHTYSAAKSWILRVKTKMWRSQQTMTPVSLVFQLKGKLFYFFFLLESQA